MTAITTTPMSISALLNPQQQSTDRENARQNINLPLRQMQLDDSDTTHHHHHHHHRIKEEMSPRYDESAAREKAPSVDNKQRKQQQTKSSPSSRCERLDSVSSTSSTPVSERRRAPRPKYTDEEMYFIWYHRVDLDEDWKDCTEAFNSEFPGQGRSERNTQGIQCKFYRFISAKKCPTVREQRRLKDGEFMTRGRSSRERMPKFGVIEWCRVWYPWMKAKHAVPGLEQGPQLTPIEPSHASNNNSSSSNNNNGNGNRHHADVASDKRMMRTYSHSSISSSMASASSSVASTPEPYMPSSYTDENVSEGDMMEY